MSGIIKKYFDVFQRHAGEAMTDTETDRMVNEVLGHSWIKKLLVFSDQALLIIDLSTMKYLYVSPSIEAVMGYPSEKYADVSFPISLMDPEDLEASMVVNERIISKLANAKLTPAELLKLRLTRNDWYRRPDNTYSNILQHMVALKATPEGMPKIQMTIATDITKFNSKRETFYSIAMASDDGSERILDSDGIELSGDHIKPRETEVLQLLSRGLTSAKIASQLQISPETVKTHRKHLLEKTNSKNSIDLVRFGFANGWL